MEKFPSRRAIERLRDGLFDPTAVQYLTANKNKIESVFPKDVKKPDSNWSPHLCVCGSYGQGKSHTLLYLNQKAFSLGYATSTVQLDPREVPFHQFSSVYRSIMKGLSLPCGRKFVDVWKSWADKNSLEFLSAMPYRFKMILTAMLYKNKRLSPKEILLKKHRSYRPKEYGYWLDQSFLGHDLPLSNLKNVLRYREVEICRTQPLTCRGNDPYFQMIQSLGEVLKKMGYAGLFLLFDEAESIAQGRLSSRAKSYYLLDLFFQTKRSVFSVFAFTDDFFDKARNEPYDDKKEIFSKNYAEAWKSVNVFRLGEFSSREWEFLLDRLMDLYSQAYQITLCSKVKLCLKSLLNKFDGQEIRCTLKALVHKLDIETQHIFLDS